MREQRAREILDALIKGSDPSKGTELPADSVVHNAEVIRALLLGVDALKAVGARAARRAMLPKNVGRPWSDDEHERLLAAYRSGTSLEDLAARHGRTVRAIQSRLQLTDPGSSLGTTRPEATGGVSSVS
jgi:hypothetical protein